MNPAQLLEHFDRISEAPDAIPRLRRFILDLAVRGKLVEQDPNDESAAELLKRIQVEKARLVKEGQAKKEKNLAPIEEGETPFSVPVSWTWARLQNITSYIQRGKSPIYATDDGLPVISQKCVQWRGLDLSSARLITKESIKKYEEVRFLRENDLLWNSTGTGTIGRVVRVISPQKNLVCDSHVTVVRCALANAEYVRSWLRSDHIYQLIEDRAAGSTNQVELTAQMATSQVVPIPPLAEQRRIVTKVDELMALCDELEAAKAEREQSRDRLLVASLHRIGNTTQSRHSGRDCRTNPPGADLHPPEGCRAGQPGMNPEHKDVNLSDDPLLRFGSERQSAEVREAKPVYVPVNWIPAIPAGMTVTDSADFVLQHLPRLTTRPAHIKQLRQTILSLAVRGKLVPQDPNDEPASKLLKHQVLEKKVSTPFSVPKTWIWATVGEIAESRLGKMLDKAKNKGTPRRYLRNVNVRWFDFDLSDVLEMRFEDSELDEFSLHYGDVLICEGGEPGRAAVWDERVGDIYFQKAIHRVRFPKSVNPHYFVNALREAADSNRLAPYFTGVGIKHFTGKGLSSFLIPLPPLAEQHRIVAKVDELMALCDQLETQLTTTEIDSRRLLEAVLHEALAPALEEAI